MPVWYILGLLKLFSALDGISFVLGPPLSNLAVGLGHATLQLSLCLLLFLKLLPQKVAVVACRLNSVGQGILGLFVNNEWCSFRASQNVGYVLQFLHVIHGYQYLDFLLI